MPSHLFKIWQILCNMFCIWSFISEFNCTFYFQHTIAMTVTSIKSIWGCTQYDTVIYKHSTFHHFKDLYVSLTALHTCTFEMPFLPKCFQSPLLQYIYFLNTEIASQYCQCFVCCLFQVCSF